MSLEALAPDQRAVVQLVLQQDRSYEDLAGLLGISTEAVRERAHRGLERLAGAEHLDPSQRADVADYLLGQLPVSRRAAARSLLASSTPARDWARAISGQLAEVARDPLPAIPDEAAAPAPATARRAREEEPERERRPEAADAAPRRDREAERRADPADAAPAAVADDPAPVRARPRPRQRADEGGPAAAMTPPTPRPRPRTSRRGGALLIGGVALAIVAIVVLLVRGGGDDNGDGGSTNASATPTATATAQFQPLGQLALTSPSGGKAKGTMVLFASQSGSIAFTLQATGVPQSRDGEAYAVWLTGGDAPHRLGFAPQVGSDGKLGTSGPRQQDADDFAKWFAQSKRVLVTRETSENTTQPGPAVLSGRVPSGSGSGSSSGSG
jgi:hypothetical protein